MVRRTPVTITKLLLWVTGNSLNQESARVHYSALSNNDWLVVSQDDVAADIISRTTGDRGLTFRYYVKSWKFRQIREGNIRL